MTYEIGVVYVWQNQVGEYSHLNGRETMVTGPATDAYDAQWRRFRAWPTDTPPVNQRPPGRIDWIQFAEAGDLRRKQPPTGEESILRMFTSPAPREVEAA